MSCEDVEAILKLFHEDSGGALDEESADEIRAAVRISADFCEFVSKWPESTPLGELEYVMNTIRSGIDSFFAVAMLSRILGEGSSVVAYRWQRPEDSTELRRRYCRGFERLKDPTIGCAQRIAVLLSLCQAQLVFLGENFDAIVGSQ